MPSGVFNTGTDTRNIKASVLHLLQLHCPHAVQVIICINLNLLYLLDRCTLVFQFLIDGLCFISLLTSVMDVLISVRVRRKLTVINLHSS